MSTRCAKHTDARAHHTVDDLGRHHARFDAGKRKRVPILMLHHMENRPGRSGDEHGVDDCNRLDVHCAVISLFYTRTRTYNAIRVRRTPSRINSDESKCAT